MPRSTRPYPLEKQKKESICYPNAHLKELRQFIALIDVYPYT